VLLNIHIIGGGKLTLDGFDATHKLAMQFVNVTFADLSKIKVVSEHADLVLGGNSTDFHPTGEDVHLVKAGGQGKPNSCQEKLVPFPGVVSEKQ
jgi:hypothetical protein